MKNKKQKLENAIIHIEKLLDHSLLLNKEIATLTNSNKEKDKMINELTEKINNMSPLANEYVKQNINNTEQKLPAKRLEMLDIDEFIFAKVK